MTSVRPPSTRACPASTVPPPFRIASMSGPTRTTSSKTTRTWAGDRSSTAPLAGSVRTTVACAHAEPGPASARSKATTRIRFFTSGDIAPRTRSTAHETRASQPSLRNQPSVGFFNGPAKSGIRCRSLRLRHDQAVARRHGCVDVPFDVEDIDKAGQNLHARALAGVLGQPVGAANGRGGVGALGTEVPGAVAPEAASLRPFRFRPPLRGRVLAGEPAGGCDPSAAGQRPGQLQVG